MEHNAPAAVRKMTNKKIYLLVLLPFLVVVFLYELLPLSMLILDSFGLDEDKSVLFTLQNYSKIFSTLSYKKAITNSLEITLLSTAIGIFVAFMGAKAAHTSRGRFRNAFMTVLNMTSNFAGVPLAFAYMIVLGTSGVVRQIANVYGIEWIQNFDLYTSKGLILMYVYFQIPLSTLLLIPAFNGIRREWQEANLLLGGRNSTFWFKVGIPVLIPSIFGTISVLFANALCAYATAYALLMNNFSLLPVNISAMFTGDIASKPHLGAALSVVMMLLMCAAILIDNYIIKATTRWNAR
ncbi:MAG TPA: ABC transporter permease [Oscillospiraceae bacterium]|nr:ABC transporter permease [Oscillospiraceae bacterium]